MQPSDSLAQALRSIEEKLTHPTVLRYAFALACAERVSHLLEEPAVERCLDVLRAHVRGEADPTALADATAQAAALASSHPGSRSLDGVGHAAVSASMAVAHALAGRALQAADYAAYAIVYGNGGYGAVSDAASFAPERAWQLAALERIGKAHGAA